MAIRVLRSTELERRQCVSVRVVDRVPPGTSQTQGAMRADYVRVSARAGVVFESTSGAVIVFHGQKHWVCSGIRSPRPNIRY